MKMIVYHLKHELAFAMGLGNEREHSFPLSDAFSGFSKRHAEAVKVLWNNGCYAPVAILEASKKPMNSAEMLNELDRAFALTNHIDLPWNRPGAAVGLNALYHDRCRSTSVGDVIKVIDNHTAKFWRVASVGFEPISDWNTVGEYA